LEKLTADLGKLRTGGRFNPEILESVRVHLVKDEKGTERLGDLAQVLPKGGRTVMVLVGEKDVCFLVPSELQFGVYTTIIQANRRTARQTYYISNTRC